MQGFMREMYLDVGAGHIEGWAADLLVDNKNRVQRRQFIQGFAIETRGEGRCGRLNPAQQYGEISFARVVAGFLIDAALYGKRAMQAHQCGEYALRVGIGLRFVARIFSHSDLLWFSCGEGGGGNSVPILPNESE